MSQTHKINTSLNLMLENKKMLSELNTITLKDTSYPNVKFDMDGTQHDRVNKPLLDDIQKAAQSVGIIATITSAKSGHAQKTSSNTASRHSKETAVDISILNGVGSGGATGPSNGNYKFKLMGDKLKDALVSMGYVWNSESGNPKAVLWHTNTGGNHYNHLHVSNESSSSSNVSNNNGTTSGTEGDVSKTQVNKSDDLIASLGRKFGSGLESGVVNSFFGESINEQVNPKMLGKRAYESGDTIIIPYEHNKKASSPVYGYVRIEDNKKCDNEVNILFQDKGTKYFLQYCGLSKIKVKDGKPISAGDIVGNMDKDVEVSLINYGGGKTRYSSKEDIRQKSNYGSSDKGSDSFVKGVGRLVSKLVTPLGNKYDESGKMIEKRWGSPTDKDQPEPWIRKMSPTYNPLKENIEKIKRLL